MFYGKKTAAVILAMAIAVGAPAAFAANVTAADEPTVAAQSVSGKYEYDILDDGTAEITGYTGSDTNLVIPSKIGGVNVTKIGNSAFYCCSLVSVTIPDSVTEIGSWAFGACTSLVSVNIPDSVTEIGYGAFQDCTNLKRFNVDKNNTAYSSQNGVLFNMDKTTLLQYPAGKTDKAYDISNSVTKIGERAFYECTSLKNVTIPYGVTEIGYGVFFGCTSLESVTIPNSVTEIGDWTFSWCRSLESVTIPDSVTEIGDYAFFNCTSLTIYGYSSSAAEKYANENGITFKTYIPAESIKLNKTSLTLEKGTTATLTATVYPSNAMNKTVTWSTTNNKVATVSKGKITAVGKGTTAITATTSNGKTAKCTVTVTEPLVNVSTISATSINLGSSIKLTAKATGGTAPYKYRYYCKPAGTKSYTALTNVTTSATYTYKPAKAITYSYAVKIADAKGKIVTKFFTVKVNPAALKNVSTISATSINLGSSIKLTAKATGGTAPYKYRYYCKPAGTKSYTALTNVTTSATYTYKPAKAITYSYAVKIADAKGKIVTKFFTVKVNPAALKNVSTISATSINLGSSIKLTAKATGGTAPYKYRFYCKPAGAKSYTALTDVTTSATYTYKPARAITYSYAVKIADAKGKTATKYFTVQVKK